MERDNIDTEVFINNVEKSPFIWNMKCSAYSHKNMFNTEMKPTLKSCTEVARKSPHLNV